MNNNVIQFRVPDPEEDQVGFHHALERMKDDTEQMVYVQKRKDGTWSVGHTDLMQHDLIIMMYHLNRFIYHTMHGEFVSEE